MEKYKNVISYLIFALLFGSVILVSFVKLVLPLTIKPEDIKIDLTTERIARGKYLATNVCVCMDCHSKRDWNKFPGPVIKGTLGMGGEEFSQEGSAKFYASNITPAALKDWTDGEILRAISCGVNKNGKALAPEMPYPSLGQMDKEDLLSIIAYMRTLTPIENEVPESKYDFPMNFIINTYSHKPHYTKIPNRKQAVAYGKYIFNAAGCASCHTPLENGKPISEKELAGGFKFPMPTGGTVFSSNITPDMETGIGNWTEEKFISTFKNYADSTFVPKTVNKGEFNTIMPWTLYSGMKTEDLKALYAYLRTVKPIKNRVIKFKAQ